MRHWKLLIWAPVAVTLMTLIALCAGYVLERRAQRKREVVYRTTLRSYSEVLRPGMTRKEVEDYLRARNVQYRQMCCVDQKKTSDWVLDDLTKIGHEKPPWACSEKNVYVAFQFIGPERRTVWPTAEDSDTLTAVTIFHWLEGCL